MYAEKEKRRKVYVTGESETNKAVMHCLERTKRQGQVVVLCPGTLQLYLCYIVYLWLSLTTLQELQEIENSGRDERPQAKITTK